MSIGAAIFLAAIGAILKYAVNDSFEDVELGTVGLILMIAGIAGALIEIFRTQMHSKQETERTVQDSEGTVRREKVEHRQ